MLRSERVRIEDSECQASLSCFGPSLITIPEAHFLQGLLYRSAAPLSPHRLMAGTWIGGIPDTFLDLLLTACHQIWLLNLSVLPQKYFVCQQLCYTAAPTLVQVPFLKQNLNRNLSSSRESHPADLRPHSGPFSKWSPASVLLLPPPQLFSPRRPLPPQPTPLAWTTAAHPLTCIITCSCCDIRVTCNSWQFSALLLLWANWRACVCLCRQVGIPLNSMGVRNGEPPPLHAVKNGSTAISASETMELINESTKSRNWNSLGRGRTQSLILLIPHIVISDWTQTPPFHHLVN